MGGTFRIFVALTAVSLGAGTALAQAGSSGPAPGSKDAKAAASESRETREDFNRAAGSVSKKKGEKGARADAAVAATAADIVAGSALSDSKGDPIGTIESVDAEGAVVASGATRVRVPLEAFGKNKNGLLLGITKAEFDAAAAQATAQPAG